MCCRREIGTDKIHVVQFHGAVIALCIEEVQQRRAAVLVGKENGVADPDGLLPLDFDGLVRDSFGELVGTR